MDYQKHYDRLIERARGRVINGYTERHHVIPRCLGGDDTPENLVELTAEEHYLAHLLLVKIHPEHKGLVWAAIMMTGHNSGQRNNNKMYGWLRRKHSQLAKQRKGAKNGSYGKKWFHNPVTYDNLRCLPEECPDGYVQGRYIKRKSYPCVVCGKNTESHRRKYCSEQCKYYSEQCQKQKLTKRFFDVLEKFLDSEETTVRGFVKTGNCPWSQPTFSKMIKENFPGIKSKNCRKKFDKEELRRACSSVGRARP